MKLLQSLLLLPALFIARGACAQVQRLPSEAASAEQRLAEDIGVERLPSGAVSSAQNDANNASTLLQLGNRNTARIDQQNLSIQANQAYMVQVGTANVLGLDQTGSGNRASLTQNGTRNNAEFAQDGQGNQSTISQQGTGNKLTGLVDGDRNEVNIKQDGTNNQVKSEIRQDNRTYNISQSGYGNTLTQLETTEQGRRGYSVEMRGVGINLTIEQSKVVPTR